MHSYPCLEVKLLIQSMMVLSCPCRTLARPQRPGETHHGTIILRTDNFFFFLAELLENHISNCKIKLQVFTLRQRPDIRNFRALKNHLPQ